MGVGRYTPNAAVNGNMGWDKPIIEQWLSVVNNWIRIKKMDEGRINKRVYNCAVLNKGPSCKNATYRLSKQFTESGIKYILMLKIPASLVKAMSKPKYREWLKIR